MLEAITVGLPGMCLPMYRATDLLALVEVRHGIGLRRGAGKQEASERGSFAEDTHGLSPFCLRR